MGSKTLYLLIFASVVYVQVASHDRMLHSHIMKEDLGLENREHINNGWGLSNILQWVIKDLPSLWNFSPFPKDLFVILKNNTNRLNDIDDNIEKLSKNIKSLGTNVTNAVRNSERSLRSEIIKLGEKMDRCCSKNGGHSHSNQNTLNNDEEE